MVTAAANVRCRNTSKINCLSGHADPGAGGIADIRRGTDAELTIAVVAPTLDLAGDSQKGAGMGYAHAKLDGRISDGSPFL